MAMATCQHCDKQYELGQWKDEVCCSPCYSQGFPGDGGHTVVDESYPIRDVADMSFWKLTRSDMPEIVTAVLVFLSIVAGVSGLIDVAGKRSNSFDSTGQTLLIISGLMFVGAAVVFVLGRRR